MNSGLKIIIIMFSHLFFSGSALFFKLIFDDVNLLRFNISETRKKILNST